MALPIDRPAAVIRMKNRNFGLYRRSCQGSACFFELLADLRDLSVKRHRSSIGSDHRAVIFFLAVKSTAPLPVAHRVGTVTHIVPGHGAHLSFIECVVDRGPVHGPGLRFHDPEIFLLESTRQVVSKAVLRDVELALADVVVPGCKVEILFHSVMVVAVKPTHRIGGDKFRCVRIGVKNFELILLVAAPGIADEAHPT